MQYIESFIKGKSPDESKCEDVIVKTDAFVAVIDGVTSKYEVLFDGKAGGRFAAETIAETIKGLDEKVTALQAFNAINDALIEKTKLYNAESGKHLQACAIIYSKYRKEVWNYGDCALMINGERYSHSKVIDDIMAGLRAFVIALYLKDGGNLDGLYSKDVGREAILPFAKNQTAFANEDGYFGYPVLNGTKINENYIKIYKVSEGDLVVLASDGYPKLFSTLEESEKHLEYILKTDPLSIGENMQTKLMVKGNISFDDRAYVSFIV